MAPQQKSNKVVSGTKELFSYLHTNVMAINNSKIFAGLIIITLNIASKFTTIKLSKTMESYLKYTFSRDVLIFAMAWMGTRDIYIALGITLIVVFLLNYLLNEESQLCVLPEHFTQYHATLCEENEKITPQQIEDAKLLLKKAELQQEKEEKELEDKLL